MAFLLTETGGSLPPAVLVFANVRYLSSAAWSAFASAMAFSWAAGGQSPRKPLCALRGPRIGCKSPEVNSADFKILPPAKYLYAGLPAERRGLPLPYFSSAAWSAFASAMAFSWAAGGQSPRKPLCAPRGPRIGCKSPEVNSADFKILPPAKYLYAGLPAERRGLPLPYFSSAAWSAFASAMAFSWAAGGQSS